MILLRLRPLALLSAFFFSLLLPHLTTAQSSNATITGSVQDATGSLIAGARINLHRPGAAVQVASATTDAGGRFTLPAVPFGTYTLTGEAVGFESQHKLITVSTGNTNFSLTLGIAEVNQSVTVTAPREYAVANAGAGTKIDMPLMETPVSVQVITSQVLEDQQTVNLVDALINVSGVAPTNDSYGSSDSFSIRGFDAKALIFQDGIRQDEYATGLPQDMANVEEIEVVKGPASVLYGQAEPGGLVNIVTKKPHERRFSRLNQQFGNHQFYRTTADINQPLVGNRMLFRFVLNGTDAKSFRDFIQTKQFNVYPSLSWRPSKWADLTLQTSFERGSNFLDNGIPFLANGAPANVPISRDYIDEGTNKAPLQQYTIKPMLTVHLAENWPLRLQYKLERYTQPRTTADEYYSGDVDSNGNLARSGLTTDYYHFHTNQVVADLPGKFPFGKVKNNFLIGFDFYKHAGDYDYSVFFPQDINIYAPVYSQPLGAITFLGYNTLGGTEYGAYVQDVAELPGRLYVLGGVRLDWTNTWEDYFPPGGSPNAYVADKPKTPRAGLLWQANDHVSLYSSYTSNYGASALGGNTPGQKFLPPESADQVEFGAKSEWLDKRLTASTAVYRIIKHNIPAPDPANPALLIAIGTERTQGVELDVAGQIATGLRLIANYSNLQAITTRDTNSVATTGALSQQGLPFGSTPHFTGNLWATWEPQQVLLRGLQIGLGTVTRSGEQAYDCPIDPRDPNGNTTCTTTVTTPYFVLDRIPHFTIVNLMTGYAHDWGKTHISAQININNLLNKRYFSNVNPSQALPGAPFTILPEVKVSF